MQLPKQRQKETLRKVCVCYFSVQCIIAKSVIPHSVIAAILDVILNISKRRKQQQCASQILQIQSLLKLSKNSY